MLPPTPDEASDESGEWPAWRLRMADALLYPIVVTTVIAVAIVPVSLMLGGTLAGVKWGLFLIGFPLLAAGSWKLRPTASWREGSSRIEVEDTRGEGMFQQIVDGLPPLRSRRLRDDNRLSDGSKLALTGVLMIVVSYLMETVFAVPG